MEFAEALLHANWSSSSEAAPSEQSPMMTQLLSTCSFTREPAHDPCSGLLPVFWSDHGVESSYCSYWPQDCNNAPSNDGLLPPADLAYYELGHTDMVAEIYTSVHMGFCAMEEAANATSLPVAAISEETRCDDFADSSPANLAEPAILTSFKSSPKRKSHLHVQDADATAIPTKKLRATQKNGKNEQMKTTRKGAGNGDAGENNGGPNGQDSSSCSSQEESSSSQEVHGVGAKSSAASDMNRKARAGCCGATDPQSLYAKKRRERINERLRILQNLVPNGTKVDISTMLEEAVQYVKFLQLQIKLLSSDDLWMYAPLAYNGMDIGLVLKNSSLQ